jgi:hypothetical protein
MNGEKRNTYKILVGKADGKRPLGSSRYRLVDNIVTCRGVHMVKIMGSRSDDRIF